MSGDPSMLIDGPIPSTLIEEISVTFLLRVLGALPRARSPWVPFRSAGRAQRWWRAHPRTPGARRPRPSSARGRPFAPLGLAKTKAFFSARRLSGCFHKRCKGF